jgi:MYXO-CTERM domain-containing protein
VIALDDPSAGYCLATGFCRATGERGPAPGILFLAVGLVSVGVVGLRRRPGA